MCGGSRARSQWRSSHAVRGRSKPAAGNEIDKVNRACPMVSRHCKTVGETCVLQRSLSGSEAGEACGGPRRESGMSTGENGVRSEPCHSSPDFCVAKADERGGTRHSGLEFVLTRAYRSFGRMLCNSGSFSGLLDLQTVLSQQASGVMRSCVTSVSRGRRGRNYSDIRPCLQTVSLARASIFGEQHGSMSASNVPSWLARKACIT